MDNNFYHDEELEKKEEIIPEESVPTEHADDVTYSYSYVNREQKLMEQPEVKTVQTYAARELDNYRPAEAGSSPAVDASSEKKKPDMGKWGKRAVAALLVAALGFGSGYGGAKLATKDINNVVIQTVTNNEGGEGGEETSYVVTATTALSGEQLAAKVTPSVVAIVTEEMRSSSFWYGSQVLSGAGSGVIISSDGYIITNYHVVGTADNITVELYDGTSYKAQLVGTYMDNDIAVRKIDATGLTPASIADSDSVKQGQSVYAFGNPEGNFSGSMTGGIVSAVNRTISVSLDLPSDSSNNGQNQYYDDFYGQLFGMFGYTGGSASTKTVNLNVIQFDAAVSPGNSGGGLFNANGELIGIVCAKSSDSNAEGLGFAININDAKEIATSIINSGTYTPSASAQNGNKALLGITVVDLTAEEAAQYGYTSGGAYIYSVTAESTMQAGLYSGDRIISIDNNVVSGRQDLVDYLADKEPGETVSVTVDRKGAMMTFEVTLIAAQ